MSSPMPMIRASSSPAAFLYFLSRDGVFSTPGIDFMRALKNIAGVIESGGNGSRCSRKVLMSISWSGVYM